MKDRILIDTSAWIAYFQGQSLLKFLERIDELLLSSKIYVPKIVIAELIQGAHSEKELAVIKEFLEAFYIIGESEETWFKAGRLSFALKKKGKTVNLTDCYIAIIAREHDCAVLTLDKHFREIQREEGIRLIAI